MKNFTTLCLKVLFNSWLTFLIIAEAEVKKKKTRLFYFCSVGFARGRQIIRGISMNFYT
jgi:hypothetical protein